MDVTRSYLILLCHFTTQDQNLWCSPETFRLSFYGIQGIPKKFELNQSKENFGFNSRFPKFGYDITLGKFWNHYMTSRKPNGRPQIWLLNPFFSCESDSRIANVRLSVCLSVTETPQPLRIAPVGHRAYQPLSLSTIEPIDH